MPDHSWTKAREIEALAKPTWHESSGSAGVVLTSDLHDAIAELRHLRAIADPAIQGPATGAMPCLCGGMEGRHLCVRACPRFRGSPQTELEAWAYFVACSACGAAGPWVKTAAEGEEAKPAGIASAVATWNHWRMRYDTVAALDRRDLLDRVTAAEARVAALEQDHRALFREMARDAMREFLDTPLAAAEG